MSCVTPYFSAVYAEYPINIHINGGMAGKIFSDVKMHGSE